MAEPRLYIYGPVLDRIRALPARPWEVGGWLLGYSDDAEEAIVVTHATPPNRGTPYFVRISGRHHRRYFDEAYESSSRHVTFLGDWHTHPGGVPIPSSRDERAMHQLAEDPDYGEGPLLIAIAGTARWPRQAARVDICFYTLDCGKPVRLHPHLLTQLPPPTDRVPSWAWPSSGGGISRSSQRPTSSKS